MILVTGATGTIGSRVVSALAQRGCGVRAMSRRPQEIRVSNVEAAYGDFDDAGSLAAALADVEVVFLASGGSLSTRHLGAAIARHDRAMISEASNKGVRKIVKLSAFGTGIDASPPLGDWHSPGENALRASDIAWTFLRPVAFASNAKRWIADIQSSGEVHNYTGDGKQGVIDPRDVAAVAVQTLLSDEHDRKVYTLTGPELLSTSDQVATLSRVLDQPIRVIEHGVEETRNALLATGLEPESVNFMMAGQEFIRSGKCAFLSDDVRQITGREANSFERWAQDTLHELPVR